MSGWNHQAIMKRCRRIFAACARRAGMAALRLELRIRRLLSNQLLRDSKTHLQIAFNVHPVPTSWGGGNQWLLQMSRFLASRGHSIHFSLTSRVDVVFIVDPNPTNGNYLFGIDQISDARARYPKLRCIHRINECDQRKGTSEVDALMARANAVADYTVFVSGWLRDYHAARWFDVKNYHAVVLNGADPRVFYPTSPRLRDPQHLRLVTHHWSDNWNKGFAEYKEIDEAIAEGKLAGVELWIIGRWPKDLQWRAAKTFGPAH